MNTGNLDALIPIDESKAAFAARPGNLNHGLPGVQESLRMMIDGPWGTD